MIRPKPQLMRLSSDRLFHERILVKYRGKRRGVSLTPSMILVGRSRGRITLGASFLFSLALQVLNRQTFFLKYAAPVIDKQMSTTPGPDFLRPVLILPQKWLASSRERPSLLALYLTPRQEARRSPKTGGAIPRSFTFSPPGLAPATSSPGNGKSLPGEYHHYEKPNLSAVHEQHPLRPLALMSSRPLVTMRNIEHRLSAWAVRRHLPLQAVPKSRPGTLQGAAAGTRSWWPIPGGRQQMKEAAAEQTGEFVYQKTRRIEQEIDALKLTIRRTEDQVSERLARRLKEMVKEQLPAIDVGGLARQVYRDLERMIRTQRERRGM